VLSCDLWRSGVARRFGVKAGRGISDYLASDEVPPLSSFVRDTSVPGVRVVTGGLSIHRPGGRLIAEQRLVDEARELADVVIMDTAPLLSASLTRELTTVVDAVVVVCRVGRTTASEAERCADLLEQLGAPALGVVLTGVTSRPFSDYFAYASPRRTRRVVEEAEEAMADEARADGISLDGGAHPNGSPPGQRRRGSGSGTRSATGSDDVSGESR
jgi:Mrp family chromosome partitioning ATPase